MTLKLTAEQRKRVQKAFKEAKGFDRITYEDSPKYPFKTQGIRLRFNDSAGHMNCGCIGSCTCNTNRRNTDVNKTKKAQVVAKIRQKFRDQAVFGPDTQITGTKYDKGQTVQYTEGEALPGNAETRELVGVFPQGYAYVVVMDANRGLCIYKYKGAFTSGMLGNAY